MVIVYRGRRADFRLPGAGHGVLDPKKPGIGGILNLDTVRCSIGWRDFDRIRADQGELRRTVRPGQASQERAGVGSDGQRLGDRWRVRISDRQALQGGRFAIADRGGR